MYGYYFVFVWCMNIEFDLEFHVCYEILKYWMILQQVVDNWVRNNRKSDFFLLKKYWRTTDSTSLLQSRTRQWQRTSVGDYQRTIHRWSVGIMLVTVTTHTIGDDEIHREDISNQRRMLNLLASGIATSEYMRNYYWESYD